MVVKGERSERLEEPALKAGGASGSCPLATNQW